MQKRQKDDCGYNSLFTFALKIVNCMNTEIQSIINNFHGIHAGEPWFGRSVYDLMDEVDPEITSIKPNNSSHSLLDLLYHMLTWAEFTLRRIEGDKEQDLQYFENIDWRMIDPSMHNWEKGLAGLKKTNQQILEALEKKDDSFLEQKVDYRRYNFRFLLNGFIQHEIYHVGQVAYLKKLLDNME